MVLYQIVSFLDFGIYKLVRLVVRLIIILANYDFFKATDIKNLADRVYVVLGVLVLFKIVISCIQYMVNPDTFEDKDKGMSGIIKKSFISVALLALVPSLFDFALQMQMSIVSTIPSLVMGTGTKNYDISDKDIKDQLNDIGDIVAYTTIRAFVSRKPGTGTDTMDSQASKHPGERLEQYYYYVTENCNNGLGTDPLHTDKCHYDYMWLISTLAGGFLLYVLLSMTLDVGIRTIKLGIIQIFAPIPISSYIVSKDKLQKFFKLAINVYIDLFIRLIVIYFIIFFVNLVIVNLKSDVTINGGYVPTSEEKLYLKVVIIIALFMFAKNAPNFICEVLGIENKGFGDMADMFRPAWQRAGGAVGALANPLRSSVGAGLASWHQSKNLRGPLKGARRVLRTIGAGARGAVQGTFDSAQAMAAGDDWAKMRQRMRNRDAQAFRRAYRANYYRSQPLGKSIGQRASQRWAQTLGFFGETPVDSNGYKEAASAINSLRSESFTGRAKGEVDKAPAMFANIASATAPGRLNGPAFTVKRTKKDASGRIVDDSGAVRTEFSVTDTSGTTYKDINYSKIHELWKKIDNGTATDADYNDFGPVQVTDINGVTTTRNLTKADASIISDVHERVGKKAYAEYVDIAVSAQARLDASAKLRDGDPDKLSKDQVDYLTSLADREVLDRITRFRETIAGLNIPEREKKKMFDSLKTDPGGWLAGANKLSQDFSTIATQRAKMEQANNSNNNN